jgi:phospholipid/cholesterol/gamma-HCH transport system substrate-binding protein
METKANPFLVGLFTIGVFVATVGFIAWYGAGGQAGPTERFRVVFSDVVTGLNAGAPVLFNGIKVGEVDSLAFAEDNPTQIVATIDVAESTPVRVDTRAQIQSQGFTGLPFVQLIAGTPDAPELAEAWGAEGEPIIYADPSTVQGLMEQAGNMMSRLNQVVERVDGVIASNQTGINNSVANIERFSKALADRSDNIGAFMDDAASAARRLSSLGERLETLSVALEERVQAIEPAAVGETVENVRIFTRGMAENTETLKAFVADASVAAAKLSEIAATLDAESIGRSVKNIEQFTGAIGERSDEAGQMIDDAAAVAAQFRETAKKIDAMVSGFSDSETGSLMTDLSGAARSVRSLADRLNGRVVRDVEAFVGDGRATLNNINRVVSRIEQNPGRFIAGEPAIREYSGNRR